MWGKVSVLALIALPSLLLKAVADSPLISSTSGQTVKLLKRQPSPNSSNEGWESRARNLRNAVLAKYGGTTSQTSRRSSGTDLVGNQGGDTSYFASLAIGTPPALFDVTLDTGSSLLWVNATTCDIDSTQVMPYNAAMSSTFQNLSDPFFSSYGSGTVSGVYVQDTVQMAGFAVERQMFGIVNSTLPLANCPVSGLVGLGWQQPGDPMPFWQTLADSGVWDSPLMAFQISHYPPSLGNATGPGGTFTMGFLNDSLYVGNIDYQPTLDNLAPYWALPITAITVQNTSIEIPTDSAYGAIDSGTSLVAGPSDQIQAIYAQIPGSQPYVKAEGFYSYPCDTQVLVSISFGGPSWFINSSDFQYAYIDSNGSSCLGAFYEISSSTPWIIGDTFLKSVYSVFRYSPPSVGFATLSETALALNGANGFAPTPSVGPVLASVTASASVANVTSTSAAWRLRPFFISSLVLAAVSGTLL